MTDLDLYPSGTIIAIHNPPGVDEGMEWFVRLPDHLIPPAVEADDVAWRSLADGEVWPLDPTLDHDVIAYPNAPEPAPTPEEGARPWG